MHMYGYFYVCLEISQFPMCILEIISFDCLSHYLTENTKIIKNIMQETLSILKEIKSKLLKSLVGQPAK